MSLPSNLTTIIVTGNFVDFTGTPIAGQVSFTIPQTLIDETEPTIIVRSSAVSDINQTGSIQQVLPISVDPDVAPTNFLYTVNELFEGGRTYQISLPDELTIDLASLAPIASYTEFFPLVSNLIWEYMITRLETQEASYGQDTYLVTPPGYTGPMPITIAILNAQAAIAVPQATAAMASAVVAQDAATAVGAIFSPLLLMGVTDNAYSV